MVVGGWSYGLVDISHQVDGKHSGNPSVLHVRDELIMWGMAGLPAFRPGHAILTNLIGTKAIATHFRMNFDVFGMPLIPRFCTFRQITCA